MHNLRLLLVNIIIEVVQKCIPAPIQMTMFRRAKCFISGLNIIYLNSQPPVISNKAMYTPMIRYKKWKYNVLSLYGVKIEFTDDILSSIIDNKVKGL